MAFKVNRQGHVIYFGLFEIPDPDNVEIDTKIMSVSCLQPEITKVIPVHVYDLEFQGQPLLVLVYLRSGTSASNLVR